EGTARLIWARKVEVCPAELVAPVEISTAAPQPLFCGGASVLFGLRARPGRDGRLSPDGRLLTVHRLLQPCLLLGLEERVVVERILVLVQRERHRVLEPGVAFLQLEVILNDLREQRRCLNRHGASCWWGTGVAAQRRILAPASAFPQPGAPYRARFSVRAPAAAPVETRFLPVRFASEG